MADPFTAMIVMDVAMMALSMAMAPHTFGPRLDDLSVSLADYGAKIPRGWGKFKIQPQIIWAEQLHEVEETDKTKGGKYTQYKYYGTWAVLLCDEEIDAVSRIWFDKRLVYDMTTPGLYSLGALATNLTDGSGQKLSRDNNMRIYLGTEDQNPDHRIVAWCEDRYGADTCPAYRGSAYIVFQEIPLEQSGNRIPQISVEVLKNKTAIYPFETLATGGGTQLTYFSPSGLIAVINAGTTATEIWDVATRTMISRIAINSGVQNLAVNDDGSFYCGSYNNFGDTVLIDPSGGVVSYGGGVGNVWNVAAGLYGSGSHDIIYPIESGGVGSIPTDFVPGWIFDDVDGVSWAVGGQSTSGFGFYNISSDIEYLVSASTTSTACAIDNGNGQFFVWQDDTVYLVNKSTFAVDAGPVSVSGFAGVGQDAFRGARSGDESIWIGYSKYSTRDLTLLETVTPATWTFAASHFPIYDRANHAIWGGNTIRYLDRISSNGATLQTVVDDVADWCGLVGQDTSALTQTVLGYTVTQGSGKDMIAPLLDIHDVDARPHDFIVQFVTRGSAPSGTILTEEFVKNDPRYTVTIQQDTDLPRRITINFADAEHEQQANNVIAQRPSDAMSATRELTVDLSTYVDTPSSAQQKADRYLRRLWNSRESDKLSLTAQHLKLEPADVTTISLDGALRNVRLDKLTIGPGTLDCEFVRDEISFAVLNGRTGPTQDGRDPETIEIPGPTKGFIVDAPLVQDADNDVNPILYYAAGSYNAGTWVGAAVYRGDDGNYDTLFGTVSSDQKATWGYAASALATADPNLWDRGNTVDVTVYGTLTSHTEAEIDADTSLNLIALGDDGRWEYIQYATATLTGTSATANTYTLQGLKRGRRGTEGNVGSHAIGDQILVLSKAIPTELGTDEIGNDMSYKVQTVGRLVQTAGAIDLTYDGDTLRPYAPARIKWTTDGTDMFGEIVRRTRVGGSWNGGSTIPLSENSEAYEVDIYHAGVIKRTITVTGTNLFTYTGTEIAADGNTVGVPPTLNAYQMSDVAGRGFALAA